MPQYNVKHNIITHHFFLLLFEAFLTRDKIKVPKYYYKDKRKWQVMHTRIRTNCTALNSDIFYKRYSRICF